MILGEKYRALVQRIVQLVSRGPRNAVWGKAWLGDGPKDLITVSRMQAQKRAQESLGVRMQEARSAGKSKSLLCLEALQLPRNAKHSRTLHCQAREVTCGACVLARGASNAFRLHSLLHSCLQSHDG